MTSILPIAGVSAVVVFLILLLIQLRYDRLVKEIWRSLKSQPCDAVFTQDMVDHLDEPVQRYFLHAIKLGTPLAAYVELDMQGSFRQQSNADWLPMRASQIVSASDGFVWKAKVGKSLINFSGADYYAQNHGRVKFSLWGLIPLVDAQSKDVDRSSVGRLCIEYIWLPSALLPLDGVAWQTVSDNVIQANFKVDDQPISLTLNIDDHGKLLHVSLPRWSDATEDKNWQYIPFSGKIQAEQTFSGYTVPTQIEVGYWFSTDQYWAFLTAAIKHVEFD